MKKIIALMLMLISIATSAGEKRTLRIEFDYKGVKLEEARAKYELESSAKLCQTVYINPVNLIAINNRIKTFDVNVTDLGNNRAALEFTYEEGGFCKYKLSQVQINFIRGKNYYHQTSFHVTSEKEWGGGGLDRLEILKNSGREVTSLCRLNPDPKYVFTNCHAIINGKKESTGQPAVLYMWHEYLTGNDLVDGITLVRE